MSVVIAKCINIEKDKKFPGKYYLYFNKLVPNNNNNNLIWVSNTENSFAYATNKFAHNILELNCSECNIKVNSFCIIYDIDYYELRSPTTKEQLWKKLGSLENPSEDEIACYIKILNE